MKRLYNLASRLNQHNPFRGIRMKCLDEIDFDYSQQSSIMAPHNTPGNKL